MPPADHAAATFERGPKGSLIGVLVASQADEKRRFQTDCVFFYDSEDALYSMDFTSDAGTATSISFRRAVGYTNSRIVIVLQLAMTRDAPLLRDLSHEPIGASVFW